MPDREGRGSDISLYPQRIICEVVVTKNEELAHYNLIKMKSI